MSGNNEMYNYFRVTASKSLNVNANQPVRLGGLFVSSATGATVKIYDGNDNTGAVAVDTFTPIAGTSYPFPLMLKNGCFIEVTGTIVATAFAEV